MKLNELIKSLQEIKEEHGDLDLYTYNDWATISKFNTLPKVNKIYSQKWEEWDRMQNELSNGDINTEDEDLYDVDLRKPIVKGLVI
ncbi:hypothetical protein [Paenibacillus sp. QZ-Y1]|uniref:hypothetical protein n=1 Tax=Paenibacillus sp. QZ-Y1 TaxID=3414511 RepID=UPI003F7AB8D0